jgi:hypothetical protein
MYVEEGHVYRRAAGMSRFVREKDSYIKARGNSSECNFPTPIEIPPGHWFVMGDIAGTPTTVAIGVLSPPAGSSGRPLPPTGPPTASASSE